MPAPLGARAAQGARTRSRHGASDDDPSGIAAYAQAGAQFGFGLTWVLLLTYQLMCAVQGISARIGVMGRYRISTRLAVGGWAATVVMGAASVGLLLSTAGVL